MVSPKLPPAEQAYMRFHVHQLSARTQEQIAARNPSEVSIVVIDGATRTIHVNRPEDVGRFVFTDDPRPAAPAADATQSPGKNYDPGYYAGSGPYRRVYTISVPPAPADVASVGSPYFTEGDVSTACKAGSFTTGAHEGGFVYLGGWSGTPDAPYGNVDAGLQYNYKLTVKSGDDYSPFMNVVGNGYVKQKGVSHIPCGRSVHLEFLVSPCYEANIPLKTTYATTCLELDVQPDPPLRFQSMIWSVPVPLPQAAGPIPGGWGAAVPIVENGETILQAEAACGGCVFKWMTSIGQKVGHPNYSDGARFTATWRDREISCWVHGCKGASATTGTISLASGFVFCSEYPLWYGTYEFGDRDCTDTPTGQIGLAQSVSVNHYLPTGEEDRISLTH
jgi:hypothetical protein